MLSFKFRGLNRTIKTRFPKLFQGFFVGVLLQTRNKMFRAEFFLHHLLPTYLCARDLVRLKVVCKSSRDVLLDAEIDCVDQSLLWYRWIWTSVPAEWLYIISNARAKRVRRVSTWLDDSALDSVLEKCPQLQRLDVRADLGDFHCLRNSSLSLENIQVLKLATTGSILIDLFDCNKLRSLSLVCESGLPSVRWPGTGKLQTLKISAGLKIVQVDQAWLGPLTGLCSLKVRGNVAISETCAKRVAPGLDTLDFRGIPQHYSQLDFANLKSLRLTELGAFELGTFSDLETLDVRFFAVNNLPPLPRLASLTVRGDFLLTSTFEPFCKTYGSGLRSLSLSIHAASKWCETASLLSNLTQLQTFKCTVKGSRWFMPSFKSSTVKAFTVNFCDGQMFRKQAVKLDGIRFPTLRFLKVVNESYDRDGPRLRIRRRNKGLYRSLPYLERLDLCKFKPWPRRRKQRVAFDLIVED